MERRGTECQEEVFHRAGKNKEIEECVTINNKKAVMQHPGTTPHGLLLGCMAGVLKRVESEGRESAEVWCEIDFFTTTLDATEAKLDRS